MHQMLARMMNDEKDEQITASLMAQEFVKRGLKSPRSASFGSVLKDYQDLTKQVRKLESSTPIASRPTAGSIPRMASAFSCAPISKSRCNARPAARGSWSTVPRSISASAT